MDREHRYLVYRLEHAAGRTGALARDAAGVVAALLFVVAGGVGFIAWHWWIAAVIGAGALSVMAGTNRAVKALPAGDMRPVVDAVRDAPERITSVRVFAAPDAHWLEVRTADCRLVVEASADWERLVQALRSRCPGATYA